MNILYDLWEQVLRDPVLTILSGVFTAYAAIIAHKISKWLGIKNEEQLRDVLHKSADNAVDYAATTIGTAAKDIVVNGVVNSVVDKAKDYVKTKNSGTLKKLKVSDKALEDIIKAKIGKK